MQQVNTHADNDGNACSWRQHRTFDQEKQRASPMSRGAKNSVQHDTIIINNILPMRKKQTNWERRQNGPDHYQLTTRRDRAIAANLNQQSRMTTTLSENQIKESHSGLIEAERGCTEKSMSNSREYQFIYTKAINNTTIIETKQTSSIYHKEPIKDRCYYVTIGMTDKPVQQRQQQQQSECAHANKATDRAGANQGNNSMSQQQPTTSRYTYNYAADMYDTIDINVIISHESRGGNMQQSVVGSHTSVDETKSTAMHSRYSVTLTTTEKKDMHRQTQTDRGSEHSSADHPKLMKAVKPSVATKRILREIFISNNTTEEEIVQEQSATKYSNATKSNNYSIMQMSKEDTMDKALKLQLSNNEVSDGVTKKALKLQLSDNEVSDKVTKNSKSYLLEQQILADGYNREITSASKRQEGTSPKETIMFKSVQNNSTANRQRTNESNQYLYEEVTRETAEERTVVTKLMQLAANRPDESKTMMATLSKQEANDDRTASTANISKETSILSNIIPAKITNKKGIDQDEQLKRGEEPAEEMKEAKQEYPRRTQLSINEAYVNSNLNREVKSANDEREFNNLEEPETRQ